MQHKNLLVFISAIFLLAIKVAMIYGFEAVEIYSPFDDSLYVTRAYEYLNGNAFGAYDPYILSKLPGISFFIAILHRLSLPYTLSVNVIYGLAGLYFVYNFRNVIRTSSSALGVYFIYLFNPITFSVQWFEVLREPITTIVFVILMASAAGIFNGGSIYARTLNSIIFVAMFNFGLWLREEDVLLWGGLIFIVVGFLTVRSTSSKIKPINRKFLAGLVASIIFVNFLASYSYKNFINTNYGASIVSDYSGGNYPGLIAAMRRVSIDDSNRLVSITQEALKKIGDNVSLLKESIDNIPVPNIRSFSCIQSGVCKEWNTGFLMWWIKESIAKTHPKFDLVDTQNYYKETSEAINQLCDSGSIKCKEVENGFFPKPKLEWLSGLVYGLKSIVMHHIAPKFDTVQNYARPLVSNEISQLYDYTLVPEWYRDANRGAKFERSDHDSFAPIFQIGMFVLIYSLIIIYGSLFILSIPLAILRILLVHKIEPDVNLVLIIAFFSFIILRIFSLGYVSIFFGEFDVRMAFPSLTCTALLSMLFLLQIKSFINTNEKNS